MTRLIMWIVLLVGGVTPAFGAPVIAIEDDMIWQNPTAAGITSRIDLVASTGAKYTRVAMDWPQIAPTRPANPEDPADPAYDWSRHDTIISELRARGIGTMITLHGTPPWASNSGKWNATPRTADAASFAAAVATRYNGKYPRTGGGVLPAIKSLSVRNEPNISIFNSPQCGRVGGRLVPVAPKAYAALLKASTPKIRAANPNVIVVAGEMGSNSAESGGCKAADSSLGSVEFTRLLHMALGGKRNVPFDMWGQHIYPVGPPNLVAAFPSWRSLSQMTEVLNKMHPRGRMPIMISETGYTTSYTPFHRYFVSETQQAKWLDLTFREAKKHPQVEAVVWFNMQDQRDWTAGLFRSDGTTKPSFDRFRSLALANVLNAKWALP